MSLYECIDRAINLYDENGQPTMSAQRGREAQEMFIRLRDMYGAQMDRSAAEAQAAKDVKRIVRENTMLKRHRVGEQLRANNYAKTFVENHEGGVGAGVKQIMVNIDFDSDGIFRTFGRRLNEFIGQHSKNLLGQTRDTAQMRLVMRELMGEATGDSVASGMARSLRDVFDDARRMYNAAGGNIGKLENWTPQKWNVDELTRIGQKQWADDMMDKLDWDRIINPLTQRPFGPDNASRDFLMAAWEGITGSRNVKPDNSMRLRSFAARIEEHRILHFKDADSWFSIADKYGNPNLFDASLGYLERMSRDIAMMKHLGPNAAGGMHFLSDLVENHAKAATKAGNLKLASSIRTDLRRSQYALGNIDGSMTTPHSEFMSNLMAGTRNLLSSAQLGGAVLSSITDFGSAHLAARHLGMARSSLIQRQTAILSAMGRDELQQVVGVLDTALDTTAAAARWVGDISGPETTRRISQAVFRASGLSKLTDLNRHVFRAELMGHLELQKGVAFDKLHTGLQAEMRKSGLTAADWDVIRATDGFESVKGGNFLIPDEVMRRTDISKAQADALGIKLHGFIEAQTNMAVPSKDLIADSTLKAAGAPGTLSGELTRTVLQYKQFPITFMMQHMRRIAEMDGNWSRAKYIALLTTQMTVLGAAAMTAKDLVAGREPRDPTQAGFWAAAYLQGGGMGIMGDYLFADWNRYGGSPIATAFGPTGSLIESIGRLTAGNIKDIADGKDTQFGREMVRFVKRYMPGGSLWYTRLAMERLVFDQLQKVVDPKAYEDFKRRERSAKDMGSGGIYWPPGQALPSF